MRHIVYITSGYGSGHHLEFVMTGGIDPTFLLDELTAKMTGDKDATWSNLHEIARKNGEVLAIQIRRAAVLHLKKHGFSQAEATEVWVGD